MFKLVVLVSFLALASGSSLPLSPVRGIGQGPIVGGEVADISETPWQVALQYDSIGLGIYSLRCGGSIIKPNVILTAGHCADGTRANRWRARAGSNSHNSGGTTVSGSTVTTHPSYSSSTVDFDIAVLVLASAIPINEVTTQLAVLPQLGQEVPAGSPALISGWGTTSSGGSTSSVLRKVTVPVVDQDACYKAYQGFNTITDRMICGGLLGEGGKDACQGDSGGPFIVDGILVGITSWGRSCALADYPGVYSRVPVLVDWVNSHS